jgi:hypothetical protein
VEALEGIRSSKDRYVDIKHGKTFKGSTEGRLRGIIQNINRKFYDAIIKQASNLIIIILYINHKTVGLYIV